MKSVIIEYQERKKPYAWREAFSARVVYSNNKIAVVKTLGCYSIFHLPSGAASMTALNTTHPKYQSLLQHLRISPTSLVKLRSRK